MMQELTLNDTGYYSIGKSDLLTWLFRVESGETVIFRCSHTNFYQNQMWSIRLWISREPGGSSIHDSPPQFRFVSALKIPVSFGVYDFTMAKPDINVLWNWPVKTEQELYLNILNMENKLNRFNLDIHRVKP